MDAEFFCLNTSIDLAGQLVRYLDRFVDPSIALKVMNTETEEWDERQQIGQRYTRLLHASIPPERELSIEANSSIEVFGSRIYLRVYWPMLVHGYYWYPGVSELVEGLYWTRFERRVYDRDGSLTRFLPALAIRDRMVLVPKGQNEILESMGPNEPAPPPLQRGVIEADFRDPVEMEQAFVTIGQALRKELRNELLAYQSFHLSDQSEFNTVSAHLGVPPSMLRYALREESDARELIYNQLRCELEPATIVKDIQTRVSLQIDNPSAVDLGELRVQVRGPSSGIEINPERVKVGLAAHGSARADFSVAATREGEFVLEVLFLDLDLDVPRDMLPMQQLWITSVESRDQTRQP
jgi:hypothetical protein